MDIPFNQAIWAFDLESGLPIWHQSIKMQNDTFIYATTPTVGNCEVYVGGSSIFAFGSEDGGVLWNSSAGTARYIQGSPLVVDGKVIAWASDNKLYAYNELDGKPLWNYSTGSAVGCPNTPAYDNGTIYAGDFAGNAFALSVGDGTEIWKVQFPAGGPTVSNVDISPSRLSPATCVVRKLELPSLYGLNPADGGIVHDISLGNQIPWAGPAFDGIHIYQPTAYYQPYIASFTGPYHVYAFNLDGSTAWTFTAPRPVRHFSQLRQSRIMCYSCHPTPIPPVTYTCSVRRPATKRVRANIQLANR